MKLKALAAAFAAMCLGASVAHAGVINLETSVTTSANLAAPTVDEGVKVNDEYQIDFVSVLQSYDQTTYSAVYGLSVDAGGQTWGYHDVSVKRGQDELWTFGTIEAISRTYTFAAPTDTAANWFDASIKATGDVSYLSFSVSGTPGTITYPRTGATAAVLGGVMADGINVQVSKQVYSSTWDSDNQRLSAGVSHTVSVDTTGEGGAPMYLNISVGSNVYNQHDKVIFSGYENTYQERVFVAPAPAVPEAGTTLLSLAGLGVVGAVVRRRRQKA
jgi:hypothetical protein